MRTTVNLDPSAFEAAKAKSQHENITLGEAISRLILQAITAGARKQRSQPNAVFRSEGGIYSSALVEASLEDE